MRERQIHTKRIERLRDREIESYFLFLWYWDFKGLRFIGSYLYLALEGVNSSMEGSGFPIEPPPSLSKRYHSCVLICRLMSSFCLCPMEFSDCSNSP